MVVPRDVVEVVLPGRRWDELTSANAAFDLVGRQGRQTVWSVPLNVQRAPLDAVAGGRHDAAWSELGRQVSRERRASVVRILVPGDADPQQAVAAFRRVSAAVRQTPGVAVEWSVSGTVDPARIAALWPGPEAVDIVGVEAGRSSSWAAEVAGAGGLADWAGWARSQEKRLAVHWPLDAGTTPDRVRQMADWLDLAARTSTLAYDTVSVSEDVEARTLSAYRRLWAE